MKTCSKCKKSKQETGFHKQKIRSDGLNPWCKSCKSLYDAGRKDEKALYDTAYRQKFGDRISAYLKGYVEENSEVIGEYQMARRRTLKGRLSCVKGRAQNTGIHFDLSIDEYHTLVKSGSCHYCGWDLPEAGGGLDRKNNSRFIGYILSNVVPCCMDCNHTKSDRFSYEQMLIIGQVIQRVKDEEYIKTRVCYG